MGSRDGSAEAIEAAHQAEHTFGYAGVLGVLGGSFVGNRSVGDGIYTQEFG
jgi:hypothetical protein